MSLALVLTFVVSDVARVKAATDCTVTDILVNPCHPWLGANVNGYPGINGLVNNVANHEKRIGRQLDVVHDYLSPSEYVSADDLTMATRDNTYLMLNWKPTANWASAGGGNATVNARIDTIAKSLKSIAPKKLFLVVYHEPENDVTSSPSCGSSVTYKGNSGTTADYVAMWHNVRARFDALGVTNVVWVMNYMGYDNWDCMLKDLWPGNNYVDWVVWDKYLHASGSAVTTYTPFYNELTTISDADHDFLSKPWGFNEWGDGAGTQAVVKAEYASMQSVLDNNTFPKIKLYDIFDNNTGADFRTTYTSTGVFDASEQTAYNTFANDPVFTNTIPPLPVDTMPPVARIDSPADQSTVDGTVPVSGAATDDTAVASILLIVDDVEVPTTGSSGSFDAYTVNWDSTSVANGTHTLKFEATDTSGNVSYSAPVTVTVANPDTVAPSVPTGLQASVIDDSSIQISWNPAYDATGVTGYNVYRDGVQIATITDGSTAYTDAGLSDSQLYQYSVSAFDAAGNTSDQTTAVSVMIADTQPPTTATGLSATVDNGQVALSWQAATDNVGVSTYDVLRDGQVIATVSDTNFLDAMVNQGQTYAYTVQAHDTAGNTGTATNPLTVTVPDTTAPSVPGALTATTDATNVDLAWTASDDNIGVIGYRVLRNGTVIGTTAATAYTDATGQQGQSYLYTVEAYDAAGNTSDPTASAACSIADVTAPKAPGQPSVKLNSSKTGVVVSWAASTDNVGVSNYAIWRNGIYIARVNGSSPSYTDTDVVQGSAYSYMVYALDAAGNRSAASPVSPSIKVPDTQPPTVPTGLTGTSTLAKTVKLTWKASTDNIGVAGYNIYRGTTKIATVSGNVLTYTATGLTSGSSYKFSVQARDAAGNTSSMSTQITVKSK